MKRLSLIVPAFAYLAACSSGGPNPNTDGGFGGSIYQPPDDVPFCQTEPRRSDSLLTFSEPFAVEPSTEYEISISADFETFTGDFEYPVPLVCTLSVDGDGRTTTSCPGYEPTDEEFRYDNIPNWQANERGEISGFRWYRIVHTAEIALTRDGDEVANETVDFEVTTSDCPEHVYDDFEDHPEYGESYRYAVGEADTSESE